MIAGQIEGWERVRYKNGQDTEAECGGRYRVIYTHKCIVSLMAECSINWQEHTSALDLYVRNAETFSVSVELSLFTPELSRPTKSP